MLDSGAFSAFKRGVVIDRVEYGKFLCAHKTLLDCYINLDVIPGRPGKPPSIEEVEDAAAQSFANYEYLRGEGLEPMPVFHCGESFQWLAKMLDAGTEYIGLGGTVGKPRKAKVEFFKKCYAAIKKTGRPVRTHGFGCTSASLVAMFPFTTIDSTSWVMAGANGYINVPAALGVGSFNYRSLGQVRVTGLGGQRGQVGAFTDLYHRHVVEFLDSLGLDITTVRVDQGARNLVNIHCAQQVAASWGKVMIFSTWLLESNFQGAVLTKANARNRLLSYWEIKDQPRELLERYVSVGVVRDGPQRAKADFASTSYVRSRTLALAARIEAVE